MAVSAYSSMNSLLNSSNVDGYVHWCLRCFAHWVAAYCPSNDATAKVDRVRPRAEQHVAQWAAVNRSRLLHLLCTVLYHAPSLVKYRRHLLGLASPYFYDFANSHSKTELVSSSISFLLVCSDLVWSVAPLFATNTFQVI
jgi:hypothetical protein